MSERVHFVGVGGAGMSAVAWLLARAGAAVSGSDAADGPYLRALAARGLDVAVGHAAARVDGVDAVVVSSAIAASNVELQRALQLGIPVWHRSEALQRAVAADRVVAVAGSHGKTTTSAMCAHMLAEAGVDATFAIGAPVLGVDTAVGGAYAGSAPVAVIEADESDGSFLNYTPEVAVVTNVEPDHLDHFGSIAAVEAAFVDFAARAGTLVACIDDPGAGRLNGAARAAGTAVVTYGQSADADCVVGPESLTYAENELPFVVRQPGDHNRLNAAAAWLAATIVGADAGPAAAAAQTFAGTGRRYEHRGTARGVDVIDDYAHHPTEIRALVAAARRDRPEAPLVVLFQPHLYSRTRLLADDFAAALTIPQSVVVIAGIYGAREEPEPGVDARTIGDLIRPAAGQRVKCVEDLRQAADAAAAAAREMPGAVVLTVGAGSVTAAADWVLGAIADGES